MLHLALVTLAATTAIAGGCASSDVGAGEYEEYTPGLNDKAMTSDAKMSAAEQAMIPQWSKGREVFRSLGCAGCHVPSITLDRAVYELPSRAGGRGLSIDLEKEGAEPRIQRARAPEGGFEVWLFSDLKRHDMGPRLAEARPDRGVPGETFLTPPLWGLARSRPYLHDASAATLEEAILAHGGEAEASREGFAALSDAGRYPLRLYLSTLTRAPRMVSP
jgi:CxxC motif-containing protein (DUF1111 family)